MAASSRQTLSLLVAAVIALLVIGESEAARRCARTPRRGVPHGAKMSGDGDFQIYIANEPTGYEPGKSYNGKRKPSYQS